MKVTLLFLVIYSCLLHQVAYGMEVYSSDAPPAVPNLSELQLKDSITRHGITWTFSSPARVGRFVNGDFYVVGPVAVKAIDPPPRGGRNGSVVNLPAVADRSGFDDRIRNGRYDPGLRAEPPVQLTPGDSLVSTISFDEVGKTGRVLRSQDRTISPVRSASILTCLPAPVAPDAFRPAYCSGSKKTVYYSRSLRRGQLPNLRRVSGTPSIAEYVGYFERPWIDTLQFGFDAPADYMPDYGREVARATSMAALLLTLDFSPAEKEPLLIHFIQYGIDLSGIILSGHPGWPAHGGHGNGRKLPILLAGLLLKEPRMISPKALFSEDMQTIHGQGWTGATALYAGHVGKEGRPGKIGWGAYEHLQPKNWPATIGEDYRRCCTSITWVGTALAARLIGLEGLWDHPPFFDYVERWMTEDDSKFIEIIEQQTGKGYRDSWARQGQAWDRFVENMWHTHWTKKKSP
jgi:hypothetical protein